jgi:hypothetical protein
MADDSRGRVIDETSRGVMEERARCIGLVRATVDRFPEEPLVRCVLLGLIEDMQARRLVERKE